MSRQVPRFIILDRDGVINEDSDEFIKSPDEWIPLPGSLDAIAALCNGGYRVFVATNQSGVGRGLFSSAILANIHERMLDQIRAAGGEIGEIYICPHAPDEGCDCRKPRPGMLRRFAAEQHAELEQVVLIGDALRDIEAARAVGARPLLVRTGKGRKTEAELPAGDSTEVFDDLAAAAATLLTAVA